ncbi:MAG: hypothetical protein JKY25_04320 [Robiginitomaculum sp.]|nr:hypothetical protein [Robiginitomaculum sp.]
MLSKLILISAIGTGAVGTGVVGSGSASGIAPTGFEFAAGPVRLESGSGKFLQAHMADHAPMSLKVKLRSGGQIQVKF